MNLILALITVLVAISSMASDSITIYGYEDARNSIDNPTNMDRLIQKFNAESAQKLGFRVNYEQRVTDIEIAYGSGPAPLADADIVQIKDAVDIGHAREQNFFTSVSSPVLEANIPAHLRARDNSWFAMSKRARIIYHHSSVDPSELSTYEDLANSKWRNQLCLRQSSKSYNKALVAFFMDTKSVENTINMISSWIANKPFITNTDMKSSNPLQYGTIEAIHRGRCKVGVANTYYLGFYQDLFPDEKVPVQAFIPQNTHVNATMYGVLNSSAKKDLAVKFLEWMSSVEAQEFNSANTRKYPTNPKAQLSPYLKQIGAINEKENKQFDLEKATELKDAAYSLMLENGWTNNPTPISN